MIPVAIAVIRDYNEDGSFHQNAFGKTCYVQPGRVDTVTPMTASDLASAVLPPTVRSAVRYVSATGMIRVFYSSDEAASVARLVGRALRGDDTNEPDFSAFG